MKNTRNTMTWIEARKHAKEIVAYARPGIGWTPETLIGRLPGWSVDYDSLRDTDLMPLTVEHVAAVLRRVAERTRQ